MKKFLPIAMAAVMSMSAVAVSAVSANAVEPLNTPVQYAQVARASLATPKISKAESVYGGVKLTCFDAIILAIVKFLVEYTEFPIVLLSAL